MKAHLYHIETISNLHVGSGEANEGVIDNLIQRDAITDLPVIHSSSLKGALREHFKTSKVVKYIFGSEANDTSCREAGAFRFFDARLLAVPVRSDKVPYLLATCPAVLKDYCDTIKLFGLKLTDDEKALLNLNAKKAYVVDGKYNGASIEDLDTCAVYNSTLVALSRFLGNSSVLVSDKDFKTLCDNDHLPVIARNYLDNGESKNLWYEQVLPRFSRLYFPVFIPDDTMFGEFQSTLTSSLIQIGGNATVGYGYCKLFLRKMNTND